MDFNFYIILPILIIVLMLSQFFYNSLLFKVFETPPTYREPPAYDYQMVIIEVLPIYDNSVSIEVD